VVDQPGQEWARPAWTSCLAPSVAFAGWVLTSSEILTRRQAAKRRHHSKQGVGFAGLSSWQPLQRCSHVAVDGEAQPGATTLQTAGTQTGMRRVRRFVKAGTAVMGVLVALLYATSFVEAMMHKLFAHPNYTSPTVALIIGLAVGALHTVAGPDHLAALAPLVIGKGRSVFAAFGLGALWGSGHATGQLVVGIGCLAVKMGLLQMHVAQALEQASGLLVGVSLVAIGLLGFKEAREYDAADDAVPEQNYGWATYATGVVHGLSLDAMLFILPAFSLPRFSAVVHVLGVVVGTLISMGCYTTVLSLFFRKSPRLKLISGSASAVSLILGICLVMTCCGITLPLPGL